VKDKNKKGRAKLPKIKYFKLPSSGEKNDGTYSRLEQERKGLSSRQRNQEKRSRLKIKISFLNREK